MNNNKIDYWYLWNNPPLHVACSRRDLEAVNKLIREGVDVNILDFYGYTPLLCSCARNHYEIAQTLIEHGANINASTEICKHTPLHFACLSKCDSIVELLLKNNANANVQTLDGSTPLHFAVQKECIEIVKLLLTLDGIDAFHKNIHGKTPLDLAPDDHKEEFHLLFYPPVLHTKSARKMI